MITSNDDTSKTDFLQQSSLLDKIFKLSAENLRLKAEMDIQDATVKVLYDVIKSMCKKARQDSQ